MLFSQTFDSPREPAGDLLQNPRRVRKRNRAGPALAHSAIAGQGQFSQAPLHSAVIHRRAAAEEGFAAALLPRTNNFGDGIRKRHAIAVEWRL